MPRRRFVILTAAAVAVGAVGAGAGVALAVRGDGVTPSRAASDRPCARPYIELLAAETVAKTTSLRQIGEVDEPAALAFRGDGSGDGLLATRPGVVQRIVGGELEDEVVLDISDDTLQDGDGGLLGLAYSPDGAWLYLYRTNAENDERVTAYPLDPAGLPLAEGEREILAVAHPPSEQHHGGAFGFGPDGFLYIGLGDGGGLGDPRENGQDPSTLLGKLLRIDPTPQAADPYRVPDDNPFVGRAGWRPEIWALGVRNPFRLSFDDATGDLWLADVGQTCWEELDRLPAGVGGLNLGWDVREGPERFEGGPATGGATLEPEHAHHHSRGWCAIVVGPVGDDGSVLHTDYCKGHIMRFWPASPAGPPRLVDTGLEVDRPVALVEGPGGATWVLGFEGDVFIIDDE